MIFIIDSNIIIAALIKKGKTRELLIDSPFILYSPEIMIKEIRKHENLILKKFGLNKDEFEILFGLITENITIVEKNIYYAKIEEANKLIGNVDEGDVPFLALALSIKNNGIWTENVKHFEGQNNVRILNTKQVLNLDLDFINRFKRSLEDLKSGRISKF